MEVCGNYAVVEKWATTVSMCSAIRTAHFPCCPLPTRSASIKERRAGSDQPCPTACCLVSPDCMDGLTVLVEEVRASTAVTSWKLRGWSSLQTQIPWWENWVQVQGKPLTKGLGVHPKLRIWKPCWEGGAVNKVAVLRDGRRRILRTSS